MSNVIDLPDEAQPAMVEGYAKFWLDLGTGNAFLRIYGTTKPTPGDDPGADPLVSFMLAKPSGTMVDGKWVLEMDSPGGYMALVTGDAVWGRLENANGDWAGDGTVTDEDGDGAFKLQGVGTHINAGGYVILGTSALG